MLGLISSGTFFLTVSKNLVAEAELPEDTPAISFPQGVASADPQADAVVLWTRAQPEAEVPEVKLLVQVSSSDNFSNIVLEALLSTGPDSDYTVRTYLQGLSPDTVYYYRFLGPNGSTSRLGRTRTAPAPDQEKNISMAFASCQSYEQAYYGSWARMLADDDAATGDDKIQFILHLGDFVYERSWNKRLDGSAQSRYVPPFPDGEKTDINRYAVSLADYRHLYKTYLSDPWLQAARARWPFICIWDDHEFCDNNFQSYNTYGDKPRLQARRKQYANQAWSEYIPAILGELKDQPAHEFKAGQLRGNDNADNLAAVSSLCIYRTLNWGKNLDLVLTDTRSYRSAPCLPKHFAQTVDLAMNTAKLVDIADGGREYNNGNPPEFLPYGDGKTLNPARTRAPGTCLGEAQRDWFLDTLQASSATWKLWGNAIPLIPMQLDMSSIPFADLEDSVFSLDPWAGYPGEAGYLMDAFASREINGLVSFSGDHHMHGAGTLYSSTSNLPVLVDFPCAGISSSPLFTDIDSAARGGSSDFQSVVYAETQGNHNGEVFAGREVVPVWNMTMLHGVLASMTYSGIGFATVAKWLGPNKANPGLKYVDTTANGYGLAQFRSDELKVQMISMEELRTPFEQAPEIKHSAHFRIARWTNSDGPKLEGPEFIGGAPFPFTPPTV
jgi:alkaline phosphatase D